MGRLTKAKGVDILLKSIRIMKEKYLLNPAMLKPILIFRRSVNSGHHVLHVKILLAALLHVMLQIQPIPMARL